jgi:hypothetical protein
MIRPDNFRADPLGWAGNQCGHMMICAALGYYAAIGAFMTLGEFPPRWLLLALVGVVYLSIELRQRGSVADTLEDVLFVVGFGGALFLLPLQEIEPGSPVVAFNLIAHWPVVTVVVCYLAFGMALRLYQRCVE